MVVDFAGFSAGFHENFKQYKLLVENFKLAHSVLIQHNPQTLVALRMLMQQQSKVVVEDDKWLQRFATITSANDGFDIPHDFVLEDSEMYTFYYFLQREEP